MPASLSGREAMLHLKQQITRVSGNAVLDGKEVLLDEVKLDGDRISFRLLGRKEAFTGQVKGRRIEGSVEAGGAKAPWSAALEG
jgi:hypothetical protein